MKRWIIFIALSGWAASASVFINLFLAFQLPVVEYGLWVKLTALLPLVSALMAPIVLMCSRVTPDHATQARQAEHILVLAATIAGILALGLVVMDGMLQDAYLAAFALWVVSICKVCVDGLLWSPSILRLGMADKIARSMSPTVVLVGLLVFRPNTAMFACLCIAAATGLCALSTMRCFSRHVNRESISLDQAIRLYLQELPSAYLSLVSLGIYSIPLFVFSTKTDHSATALLGISLTVVQGASAFATIILSQHLLSVASVLTPGKERSAMKIGPPIAISLMCCFLAPVVIGSYGIYHSIPIWPMLALATGFLVLVETSQGMMTTVLLRLGKRKVIVSATVSAIFNILLGVTLVHPIQLICAIAGVQFFAFLLPGIWQIYNLVKVKGSNLHVSL
jgi:hypothetical protein